MFIVIAYHEHEPSEVFGDFDSSESATQWATNHARADAWVVKEIQAIPHSTTSDFAKILPELAAIAKGRDTLKTREAAKAINRAPQTLRKWACLLDGPIRPIRIYGRLAWKVSDLQSLLSGGN